MKTRGDGRTFRRKETALWWCAYYLRGKEYRESTGETDEQKAKKFLKRRLKEVGADQIGARPFVGPAAERIEVSCDVTTNEQTRLVCDCLCCVLERDFKFRGKSSAQNISNLKRVRRDFGHGTAIALTA